MRRPLSPVFAGVLVAVALASCSGSSAPAAGRLTVDGQAEILRPGEPRRDVAGSQNLKAGDRVRVRQGDAVIRLSDNRRLELRTGSDIELQEVEKPVNVRPNIIGGDLLVISDDRAFAVAAANAVVAVQGDARVSRGVALLVATYEGTAQLSAGGSTLTVPALRQAALPATGQFPTAVTALEFSPSDGWDQRYLSEAMDLSSQLDGRSNAFSSQLGPTEGRSFNYFRELFPRLAAEPGFTAGLVNAARQPGETLVGAAITLEGTRGSFAERWAAVFGFRDQNAGWGLVALDQGVSRPALLTAIDGAISRGPTQFAAGPPSRPPTSLNPPGGGATTVPPPTTSTTVARPRPGATTSTTTAAPAPGGTTGTSIVGPINTGTPLDSTLNSLLNSLTGILKSLGQQ
jgi:hypothetical protein